MSLTTYNPYGTNFPDGSLLANNLSGKQGEQLGADLHGKWYNSNIRRNLFHFVVDNVALPVIWQLATNGTVSTFALWNPPSSNVVAEIVSTSVGNNLATTITNTISWYTVAPNVALTGVFTTKATAGTNYLSGRVGDTPAGGVVPYTSYAFSSAAAIVLLIRQDTIATMGGTTNATTAVIDKQHEGRLILPPGNLITVGVDNAVFGSSSLQVTWAEWPFA